MISNMYLNIIVTMVTDDPCVGPSAFSAFYVLWGFLLRAPRTRAAAALMRPLNEIMIELKSINRSAVENTFALK